MSFGTEMRRRMSSPDELCREYPLPTGWATPDLFAETVCINGVDICVAGFSTQNDKGEAVVGSAAALSESPIDRAYFELLERASLISVGRGVGRAWDVRDESGTRIGSAKPSELSSVSPEPGRWRYALSNGVALGRSWRDACRRALWELIERDRILRSWYGEFEPVPIEIPFDLIPAGLGELYSFEAYSYREPEGSHSVHVIAMFGFPLSAEAPLLCGFGARDTRALALSAAFGECLQRLGFLWGEQIPAAEPEFFPTAEFHQEWFLWPLTHDRVRAWLAGEHTRVGPVLIDLPRQGGCQSFVDITPTELQSRIFVAKGIPRGELALVFGKGHPSVSSRLPDALQVHPIA